MCCACRHPRWVCGGAKWRLSGEREVIYLRATEGILCPWRVTHSALSAAARPQSEGREPVDKIACVSCILLQSDWQQGFFVCFNVCVCVCGTFLFLRVSTWQMDRNTVQVSGKREGMVATFTGNNGNFFRVYLSCLFVLFSLSRAHTHTHFLTHQHSRFILNKQFLHSAYI